MERDDRRVVAAAVGVDLGQRVGTALGCPDAGVSERIGAAVAYRLTPEGYFLARIVLTAGEQQLKEAKLHPGMQAETMIITGTRSALSYFLKPLTYSFSRAFHEG